MWSLAIQFLILGDIYILFVREGLMRLRAIALFWIVVGLVPDCALGDSDQNACRYFLGHAEGGLIVYDTTQPISESAIHRISVDHGGRHTIGNLIEYKPSLRFFYVAQSANDRIASGEAAWAVKSKTLAASVGQANAVFVRRDPVTTSCGYFSSFSGDSQYIDFQRYVHHHSEEERRPDDSIHRYFHFAIHPRFGVEPCRTTDDRKFSGQLSETYGFNDTKPEQRVVERITDTSAEAETANSTKVSRYASLTSSLFYVAPNEAACLAFDPPLPTYDIGRQRLFDLRDREARSRDEALVWQPKRTEIQVRRLARPQVNTFRVSWH
jgi:hypothetical protein